MEGALQAGQGATPANAVAVDRLAKSYGARSAIEELSFAVRENEFVSVVGLDLPGTPLEPLAAPDG